MANVAYGYILFGSCIKRQPKDYCLSICKKYLPISNKSANISEQTDKVIARMAKLADALDLGSSG